MGSKISFQSVFANSVCISRGYICHCPANVQSCRWCAI